MCTLITAMQSVTGKEQNHLCRSDVENQQKSVQQEPLLENTTNVDTYSEGISIL